MVMLNEYLNGELLISVVNVSESSMVLKNNKEGE